MHDESLLNLKIPLRLAVTTAQGLLIVPLWFEAQGPVLWCASQADSLLVRALRAAPCCAFDLSTNDMPYRGLRGRGHAVCYPAQGEARLQRLLLRYLGSLDTTLARRLLRRAASEVAIEITPAWRSGWDYTSRMRGSLGRGSS